MALPVNLRLFSRQVILLLVVGLTLRIVFIALHQHPLISDERDYHKLAVSLATTGSYEYDGVSTAYRPFAYPALMSLVYLLAGEQPIVVKILQALFDLMSAILLYLILEKENERARTIALGLWCFYLPAVLYTNLLFTETIFTFLLVACCYAVIHYKIGTTKDALLTGGFLGILTLMKPGMLLLIILLPAALLFARISLRKYSFVLIGAALVLAPWVIRNYVVLGKPTIITNGGINLLIGNNPNATGGYTVKFPENIFTEAETEIQADESAFRYATEYILNNPTTFVVNGVKKIAHLFSSENGLLVLNFHENPEEPSERFSVKYASIPLAIVILVNLAYMSILLLGILGLFNSQRDMLWWFVVVLIAYWLVTHVVVFGGSRFHFPLMPFFALFASLVIPNIRQAFQKLTTIQKSAFGILVVSLCSIWVAEIYTVINAL